MWSADTFGAVGIGKVRRRTLSLYAAFHPSTALPELPIQTDSDLWHINGRGVMRIKQLPLRCDDYGSDTPIEIRRVCLTSLHQILVHFRCGACKRDVYLVFALSECWRECPESEDESTVGELITFDDMMREPDIKFLRSMGVALPEEKGC
jgi:hypothetical protein